MMNNLCRLLLLLVEHTAVEVVCLLSLGIVTHLLIHSFIHSSLPPGHL